MDKLNEKTEAVPHDLDAYARGRRVQKDERTLANTTFYEHWDAIRADGITASQFMAFLQPLADLDGMTVSYIYGDEDGQEHLYNRRRG